MAPIPLPENPQLQSPLLRLPAEIKHIIFRLCMTFSSPIQDPIIVPKHSGAEAGGSNNLALLQTCRRLYFEVDRRPLYAQNVFRFTTAKGAADFIHSIDQYRRGSIQHVEIDIRKINSDQPHIAHEWLEYLSETGTSMENGLKNSLRIDAPGLKTLSLNFESWPKVAMFRTDLWKLLRNLLAAVDGLERVVIIGASKGLGMTRYAPWSPTHFIGGNAYPNDLVPRMWACVNGPDDSKLITWIRQSGNLHLEVVSMSYFQKHIANDVERSRAMVQDALDSWPENGFCTWGTYRKSPVLETIKGLNPNAFG